MNVRIMFLFFVSLLRQTIHRCGCHLVVLRHMTATAAAHPLSNLLSTVVFIHNQTHIKHFLTVENENSKNEKQKQIPCKGRTNKCENAKKKKERSYSIYLGFLITLRQIRKICFQKTQLKLGTFDILWVFINPSCVKCDRKPQLNTPTLSQLIFKTGTMNLPHVRLAALFCNTHNEMVEWSGCENKIKCSPCVPQILPDSE